MDPTRRELLLALGATGAWALTGCASGDVAPGRAPGPGTTTTPSPSPSASPTPTLPSVPVWRPSPGDLQPGCKRAAVDEVLARGQAAGLRVEVVDAQYGGLLATTASVLVVTRSSQLAGGRVVRSGRTFDARLSRAGGRPEGAWRVDRVLPSQPGRPAPRLPAVARRVLASDRLDLPPAARADVASGRVGAAALAGMLELSRSRRLGISVVRSGHPIDVFGTDRPSDHPRGRAFDVWSVDGRAVVDPGTPERLVTGLMRAAAEIGAYNVGGPVLLGAPPQFFGDDTHHDHVHVGFPV